MAERVLNVRLVRSSSNRRALSPDSDYWDTGSADRRLARAQPAPAIKGGNLILKWRVTDPPAARETPASSPLTRLHASLGYRKAAEPSELLPPAPQAGAKAAPWSETRHCAETAECDRACGHISVRATERAVERTLPSLPRLMTRFPPVHQLGRRESRHWPEAEGRGLGGHVGLPRRLRRRFGRLRTVVEGPREALYVLTSNRDGRGIPSRADDRILRLTPPRSGP
jgi:hypothetical protein